MTILACPTELRSDAVIHRDRGFLGSTVPTNKRPDYRQRSDQPHDGLWYPYGATIAARTIGGCSMYPVLIITFLAAAFVSLTNLGPNANPFEAPSAIRYEFEARSDGHGVGFGGFVGGVQRMVSLYRGQVDPAVFQEIHAQIAASGGAWTVTWANMNTFLAGSPFATGEGIGRDYFFPPSYDGEPAWRVTLVGRRDAAGALMVPPDNAISAFVAWADPGAAPMNEVELDDFLGGFSRTLGFTTNAGVNQGGTLVAQGQRVTEASFNGGGNLIAVTNIPGFVPNGAVTFVQCRMADDPGADGIPNTGDDANDGFCE